jgi:hypothetical protein
VEHRGDRLVLVAAVLDHQAGDDEQMGQIRDLGSGAALVSVDLRGERDSGEEPLGQCGWRSPHRLSAAVGPGSAARQAAISFRASAGRSSITVGAPAHTRP